ncbi:MAG: glycosyltransferase [Lachnospiraceae bacterium]|nr:glycosyltransferase [Lachnospiraceae bacterium]
MKVLYMSHRYHTNQNTIMKGWKENGHEICFISQFAGKIEDYTYVKPIVLGYGAVFRAFDWFYINVLFRKKSNAIDMKLKCGWPPIRKMVKIIREFQPDVAIIRERSIYSICMTAICRYYHIPTILYNLSPVWDFKFKDDLAHKLVWKLTPKYRMTPVDVVGISYDGKKKDENSFWAPFLMEPQLAYNERKYFQNDRINLFCIGKYQERKNLWMMVYAVERLGKKYPLHLTITGELSNHFHQEYYDKITGYVKEHGMENQVSFYTNLNKKRVMEEYANADLYVIPSTGEPASITVIEGMAFSIPVISGSDNGSANYIENGKTGYVFEDCDQRDLEEKIELIIQDKNNMMEMGKAAYEHVKKNFQFDRYYGVVEEILREQKKERE